MFEDTKVAARFSVQDLQRAKAFYAEKLGLEPSEERPGGLSIAVVRGSSCSSSRAAPPQESTLRCRGK